MPHGTESYNCYFKLRYDVSALLLLLQILFSFILSIFYNPCSAELPHLCLVDPTHTSRPQSCLVPSVLFGAQQWAWALGACEWLQPYRQVSSFGSACFNRLCACMLPTFKAVVPSFQATCLKRLSHAFQAWHLWSQAWKMRGLVLGLCWLTIKTFYMSYYKYHNLKCNEKIFGKTAWHGELKSK